MGAGFIGMETAASLRALGVEVALVAPGALYGQFRVPGFSGDLAEALPERGRRAVLGDSVSAFSGDEHVRLRRDGSGRTLEAERISSSPGSASSP